MATFALNAALKVRLFFDIFGGPFRQVVHT
jgi:hypothetical protein